MKDAVPICRSVEKHWVFQDAEHFKLWYCMLSRTQYTVEPNNGVYQGIMYTQHRGEFLFGRREWCRRYGVSEQRIRKFIDLLVADGMIVRSQLTRKFSLYRVVNYDKFNPLKTVTTTGVVNDAEPTETPQKTHRKPMKNPQTTTINTINKDKTFYADNVSFTEDEYRKLIEQFGKTYLETKITDLSLWKLSSGKEKKSDYATILMWARKDGYTKQKFQEEEIF